MKFTRDIFRNLGMAAAVGLLPLAAMASPLATESQAAVPFGVQQVIVVDYQAMQSSNIAMQLRDKVLPPELKSLQDALQHSGMNVGQSIDQLAFASFMGQKNGLTQIVGIASGQFPTTDILANFKKKKIKGEQVRNSTIYPMGGTGLDVAFLDQTTMVFGSVPAVKAALDARDGITPSFLSNNDMLNLIPAVQNDAVWSIMDSKGTQTMMKSVLGEASGVADFDVVKKRLLGSRYTMDFEHGVKFNLDVLTSDTMSAATMSSLLSAAALYKKMGATPSEKTAIDDTKITSSGSTLQVDFSASDNDFASLLNSSLFQSVVH